MKPEQGYLTVNQAAKLLGLSRAGLLRHVEERAAHPRGRKGIKAVRKGCHWVIAEGEVAKFQRPKRGRPAKKKDKK